MGIVRGERQPAPWAARPGPVPGARASPGVEPKLCLGVGFPCCLILQEPAGTGSSGGFTVLPAVWVVLPSLEFCASVIPRLYVHIRILSLVSFES